MFVAVHSQFTHNKRWWTFLKGWGPNEKTTLLQPESLPYIADPIKQFEEGRSTMYLCLVLCKLISNLGSFGLSVIQMVLLTLKWVFFHIVGSFLHYLVSIIFCTMHPTGRGLLSNLVFLMLQCLFWHCWF